MKPKTETPTAEHHYYRMHMESETGKRLAQFWHHCQKADLASHEYCKKFGAQYFEPDPFAYEGGVACVAFADESKIDLELWRPYVTAADGVHYYIPRCEAKIVSGKMEYRAPSNEIIPDGFRIDKLPKQKKQGLRRAIKAEQKRRKLPLITVDMLYKVLHADVPDTSTVKTPTFFPYSQSYYVGCAYPCQSPDMEEITPQQYKTRADKYRLSLEKGSN